MSNSFYEGIKENIEKHGCSIVGVGGSPTTPTFAYTIGLSPKIGFEVIMIGVPIQYAHSMLNDISYIAHRKSLGLDEPYDEIGNFPIYFKACDQRASEWGVQAERFYEKPVKFAQAVYPDRAGIYPWQDGYDHAYMDPRQPMLFEMKELAKEPA